MDVIHKTSEDLDLAGISREEYFSGVAASQREKFLSNARKP